MWSAYYNRGAFYASKGQWKDAIADYTEAIRLNPSQAKQYYFRGRAYLQSGERNKAAADFAEAEKLEYKRKGLTDVCVYYVGSNEVTLAIHPQGFVLLADSRGHGYYNGFRTTSETPTLQWIWEHPKGGDPGTHRYGRFDDDLPVKTGWNALCVQPCGGQLHGKNGDLAMASNFINLTLANNPDLQVYVYAAWPRPGNGDFDTAWLKKYAGGNDGTNESRDYFEQMTLELRKSYPKLKNPVLMVPVGHVMYELNQRIKAGKVPGYKDVTDLCYGRNGPEG